MLAKFGVWEILAIVAVISLIFGTKRLPELGKSFGSAIGNFKKEASGHNEVAEEVTKDVDNEVTMD